ncbi:MAG TPA: Wzz/FepE/Etk N-terminal domain-containing protein [Steroidobacteraceae bacterium]|nr:Wzz/FepE/Etk N-terminal domain-containing protein [Steroidobacteraceae bacterium]
MNDTATITRPDPKLKSLAEILLQDRRLIIVITCIFTLGSGVGAYFQQKQYKGSVQVSVVTDEQHGGGALMSQFGALASLAGVNVGGQSQKFEALALLQSRFLTEMFIQQNNLLPVLFPKLWDKKAGRWITNDPKQIPTLWKGDAAFKKIRSVVQDPKTELVTVSITWPDPVIAANWANELVALTNKQSRERVLADSDRHIEYLRGQAERTQLVPVQEALSNLMENEYKQAMLAGGNSEYALKVIDPAVTPESPSSLRRGFIVLGGFFGGLFVACFMVFLRASWRGER